MPDLGSESTCSADLDLDFRILGRTSGVTEGVREGDAQLSSRRLRRRE